MKKLLNFLITSIVKNPKDVSIKEVQEQKGSFVIKTHPDDLKIVIGKKGRTIKAIREVAKILAIKKQQKVNILIKE